MLESTPLTWVDVVVAAVVLLSAILAFSRGFVHEVLSVAAWVGAIFAAIYGFPYLRPYARELIGIDLAADIAAGAVIFIVSLIVLSLLTGSITSRVKDSALNALDRSLGFLFGILRGAVLVCLAYILVGWIWTPEEQPAWLRESRSLPLVQTGADTLRALMPSSIQAAGAGTAGQARDEAERAMEMKRLYDEALSPRPKSPQSQDRPGYSDTQRDEMNRLFDSTGR